jgi:hypothetical protein
VPESRGGYADARNGSCCCPFVRRQRRFGGHERRQESDYDNDYDSHRAASGHQANLR